MKKFILAGILISLMAVSVVPVLVEANNHQAKIVPGEDAPAPTGCDNLTGGRGIKGVVDCVIVIFGYAITVMVAAAVVLVMYGAFLMITSEEKRASGRQTVIYGVVGLFIMISVWGFVAIIDNTFKLSSQGPIKPQPLLDTSK